MVELKHVNKIYPGVHALKDIDFVLRPGEVHCLVGENGSGKSTLIKILSGVEVPEPGSSLIVDGVHMEKYTCETALHHGIQVIYQDISLFKNLSVKENIVFRQYANANNMFVNWKSMDVTAQRILDEIEVDIDINAKVSLLSIAQQQLVEIARSLSGNIKLLILDEPTASLTRKEVNALFKSIHKLKEKDISILFVSHKLNEVFEIAERVTVLRDGNKVGEFSPSELSHDTLTYLMTGEKTIDVRATPLSEQKEVLLKVVNLSKKNNYKDINFELVKGEILGISGLLGSGRTELALSLFGMLHPDSGQIYLENKQVVLKSQVVAKRKGIAYVPENRRDDGLVQEQAIADNLVLTTLNNYLNKWNMLDCTRTSDFISQEIENFNIKVGNDVRAPANTLSGGNQQKLVLSKWIATHPKVLILDEPTIGIDILAKNSIHNLIKNLADSGLGVILISDELQEVVSHCHRVIIMRHGKFVYEFYPEDMDEQLLLEKFNLS